MRKYFSYDDWKTTPPDHFTEGCPICGEDLDRDGDCAAAMSWRKLLDRVEDRAWSVDGRKLDIDEEEEDEIIKEATRYSVPLPRCHFCYFRPRVGEYD